MSPNTIAQIELTEVNIRRFLALDELNGRQPTTRT